MKRIVGMDSMDMDAFDIFENSLDHTSGIFAIKEDEYKNHHALWSSLVHIDNRFWDLAEY